MSDLAAAREALLADAREEAERVLAAAEADAQATLARAREEADAVVARAREQGRSEGRVTASREEAQVHMLARMEVLAARRASFEELRRRAREAAIGLSDDPGYAELLERLTAAAHADLGGDADVEVDPPGVGGVRARRGSRRVDYTLAALTERCVAALGPRARRLWT